MHEEKLFNRSTTKIKAGGLGHEEKLNGSPVLHGYDSLECPVCGEDNLHLTEVRQGTTEYTNCAVDLLFGCEHCPPKARYVLRMTNYKGTVFYGWL